jgi:hypothetical protein
VQLEQRRTLTRVRWQPRCEYTAPRFYRGSHSSKDLTGQREGTAAAQQVAPRRR